MNAPQTAVPSWPLTARSGLLPPLQSRSRAVLERARTRNFYASSRELLNSWALIGLLLRSQHRTDSTAAFFIIAADSQRPEPRPSCLSFTASSLNRGMLHSPREFLHTPHRRSHRLTAPLRRGIMPFPPWKRRSQRTFARPLVGAQRLPSRLRLAGPHQPSSAALSPPPDRLLLHSTLWPYCRSSKLTSSVIWMRRARSLLPSRI